MLPIKTSLCKVLFALIVAMLLGSCSAARLGYSNGETITAYWLDGYVDFTSEQQAWTKERIDGLFTWHRQTQLPDYVQLLTGFRERLHQPVSGQDVLGDYDAVKDRLLRIADRASPAAAELLLKMEPAQITHLEKKFASNNEKFRREFMDGDAEDQQAARYRKVLKQAEYWFGSLSREQKAQVRAASDARPLELELWLEERRHRQQVLLSLMRRVQADKPLAETVERMLKDYARMVLHAETEPQRAAFLVRYRKATADMVASILHIATAEQKTYAAEQLQKWIGDFKRLSATQR